MWMRVLLLCGVLVSGLVSALAPSALAAQSVYHTVAGVRRAAPQRAEPLVMISQQEAESSLGLHIVLGALIGGALGAGIGSVTSECSSGLFGELCSDNAALRAG
jgi:hypothetical protein